jgi:hypothetical protein
MQRWGDPPSGIISHQQGRSILPVTVPPPARAGVLIVLALVKIFQKE